MATIKFYCILHPGEAVLVNSELPRVDMISGVLREGSLVDIDVAGFEMLIADAALPGVIRVINRNIRALLTEGGYRHRKSIGIPFDFEGARHFLQPEIYTTDELIAILISLRKLAMLCIERGSSLMIEEHNSEKEST